MTNMTEDYLKVDEPIPGQKFVCLSFVEPIDNDLIQDREAFFASRFLKAFCEERKQATEFLSNGGKTNESIEEKLDLSYDNIKNRFSDFKKISLTKLQQEFESLEDTNDRNTMRGIKVRGTFPSARAAQSHAMNITSTEPAFHVFVGQVGYWMPFMPQNVEDIKEQHYDESKLNELVKHQNDDVYKRKLQFEDRKMAMLLKQNKEQEAKKEKLEIIKEEEEKKEIVEEEQDEDILEILDSDSESEDDVSEVAPIPVEEEKKQSKKPKKISNKQKGKNNKRRKQNNRRRCNRRN